MGTVDCWLFYTWPALLVALWAGLQWVDVFWLMVLCAREEKSALGTLCSEQNLSSGGGASPLQMLKIAES